MDELTGSTKRALLAWDADPLKRVGGPKAHALRLSDLLQVRGSATGALLIAGLCLLLVEQAAAGGPGRPISRRHEIGKSGLK